MPPFLTMIVFPTQESAAPAGEQTAIRNNSGTQIAKPLRRRMSMKCIMGFNLPRLRLGFLDDLELFSPFLLLCRNGVKHPLLVGLETA
jgi:hypothetical protein